ncbi:MAG: hypothetical protein Q6364_12045 [Candidatus Hermodarchaeota archaeon]|jgi:hypothetical protein|nr:hypothetical protein [Candidatus Hermodarchaeota archaeon]
MKTLKTKSNTQSIALTAILAAVYVAYAFLSSYLVGSITHGIDNFIIRSLLFVVLAGLTTGFGYSTMMGGISGLILEFTVPSPVRFYLLPSLLAYGLIFDIAMNIVKSPESGSFTIRAIMGTFFASMTMSVVALAVFTLVGFFPQQIILIIWTFGVIRDVVLGILGAVIGLLMVRQLKHLRPQ